MSTLSQILCHLLLSVVSNTTSSFPLCFERRRQSCVLYHIFSYTCRTSRSYWTAAPPCVASPHSRWLAVALVSVAHSRAEQKLLGYDVCIVPESENICFRHPRYRCRAPCSSWHSNPLAYGSTSILDLSWSQCTVSSNSSFVIGCCSCPSCQWNVLCVNS